MIDVIQKNIVEIIEVAEQGPAGVPGSIWRNGHGVPSNTLGINGDYYLNVDNGNVYQKVSGVYTLITNIEGPPGPAGAAGSPGAPGSVWRNGSGVPSNSLGINGDYYLDDATGNVYQKASGAYTIVANIEGPPGPAGAAGAAGQGVPTGGTATQVLAKIDGTNYNTHWVDQTGGGGGGFIQNQRPVTTGTSSEVLLSDGNIMILWNSATVGAKTQIIPDSTGSLQIIMIVDFYGNSGTYPITAITELGVTIADVATDKNTMTLMDSVLGWVLQ